jgi:hypothetical protein
MVERLPTMAFIESRSVGTDSRLPKLLTESMVPMEIRINATSNPAITARNFFILGGLVYPN